MRVRMFNFFASTAIFALLSVAGQGDEKWLKGRDMEERRNEQSNMR